MLQCPKCKLPIKKQNHQYECENGHSYDIAKRGYVNLVLANHKQTGDDKGMVRARTEFLAHGYYHPLRNQLLSCIKELHPDIIVDAGCGQGYYTNAIKDEINCEVYGFDLSKFAIDEACKAHNGTIYSVANIFHLPIMDTSCDVMLSVFAPFDEVEALRVLQQNGYVIKVGPGPKHLYELKQALYEQVYENEAAIELSEMKLVKKFIVKDFIEVQGKAHINALFQMTPYYWKSPKETSERVKNMESLGTTIEFEIQIYQKG